MSFGFGMEIGGSAGQSGNPRYTIEHAGHCILIFGYVPASAFQALTRLVPDPKRSVMCAHTARLAEANFAMGLKSDLDALAVKLEPMALDRAKALYGHTGLSDAAIRWIAVGERGRSSEAMFAHLSGVRLQGQSAADMAANPGDAGDFGRCRALLEAVPELADKLPEMAKVSPVWALIVEQWPELVATMDAQAPLWRQSKGSAPTVGDMLDSIESSVRAQRAQSVNDAAATDDPQREPGGDRAR